MNTLSPFIVCGAIMFGNVRFNTLIMTCMIIFSAFCYTSACVDEEATVSFFLPWIPSGILSVLFPLIFARHMPKLVYNILNRGKLNEKFKLIFDKLNETIIIMDKKENSISYINDYFYHQFKEILVQIPELDKSYKKHGYLMDMKIFNQFKSDSKESLSMNEIIQIEKSDLRKMVFVLE